MIPVSRKVVQLNIKYRKWGPIIDVCTGAPPDKVTVLMVQISFETQLGRERSLPITALFTTRPY